ncbi:MAG: OB-fold domain-containing protein [Deltaproteobacteria bacterium]|nr:OB-fold domain-containing protein [Deltaproteobacteria bacterium]
MPERRAAHPGLYPASGEHPPLLGQRCAGCGHVAFPPNPYGCESCGAEPDALESRELAGAGELAAFATVHLHMGKGIEAPFTVGVVVLDDGPAVRATLTCPTDEGLRIGDRVQSVLVSQGSDDDGNETVELRFAPLGASDGGAS